MSERGFFVAIEGGDGSGKGTQTELLHQHYSETLGREVLKLSFPRYGEDSAYYAGRYLDGGYGEDPNAVPADLAVLAFAIDRYAAGNEIRTFLKTPKSLAIFDRYMASNLAHQGAKMTTQSSVKNSMNELCNLSTIYWVFLGQR
jgi:dTMP kinase